MKNKILPVFLIFSLIITGSFIKKIIVQADNATSSVTVTNTAPSFTTSYEPHEDPASATSTPTDVGNQVTFKAKASDVNGDDWKLLVCTTGAVSTTSCAVSEWCHSNFASSTAEATCSYTALVGDTETKNWYGFACDTVGCSAESHKTDDSGPPFHVNHRPAFTVFTDDSPKNPATTVTWSTTASDPDSGGSDTVTLYVCKTASFSTSTGCGAGEWCHSSASASNPTCATSTTPRPDGDYDSYGFVKDNHNFAASGGAQGTNSTMTISNVNPSISASSINLLDTDGSGNLTLTGEQTETANFKVTFIVIDDNSCKNITDGNEIASALINVRMSEITQAGCDATGEYNANNCYPDAYATWNPVCAASSTVDSCTGNTDTSVGWACTFPLQYHADPTVTNTPKDAYNWVAAVQATDDDAADTGLVDSTTYSNEMDKFMSYDLNTASISYGTVAPDNDSLEQTTIVEATGNVGVDENLSGTQLCNDYPTCAGGNDIAIAQQNYSTSTPITWGGAGAVALSAISTEAEINCLKTTVTATPETKGTYWMLRVPTSTAATTYTGQNTIEGKTDNETYGG